LINAINNLQYDKNGNVPDFDPSSIDGFGCPDYADEMYDNRAYKCFAARNIYFS